MEPNMQRPRLSPEGSSQEMPDGLWLRHVERALRELAADLQAKGYGECAYYVGMSALSVRETADRKLKSRG